jgi:hypothetical protein
MAKRQIFEVDLVVRGLNLDDDNQLASIFDMFGDDVQVSGSAEDGRVHLLCETDDPMVDARRKIDKLNASLPEIKVLRIDPGLVATSDIARRLGRSRENIRQFVNGTRGPGGFPIPDGIVGDGIRVWRWANVQEWLCGAISYDFTTVPIPPETVDLLNASLGTIRQIVGMVATSIFPAYTSEPMG